MHQYEPQALRLLSDGTVAIDIADDKFNLANYQGLFATLAVSALPSGVSQDELNKEMWAPLNAPLRALPSVGWVNDTGAIDKNPCLYYIVYNYFTSNPCTGRTVRCLWFNDPWIMAQVVG